MCGILFVATNSSISQDLYQRSHEALILPEMLARGPDNQELLRINEKILLGHTRLAILDLSEAGNQPLSSVSGQFTISYNGEIYNYKQLADHYLRDSCLRGSSDTQVLLLMIERYGIDFTLSVIDGDYAFVLIDNTANNFYLVRDPFGCKPLYIYNSKGMVCASSRIDVIHKALGLKPKADLASISEYLHAGFGSESSHTWFSSVSRVSPGCYFKGSFDGDVSSLNCTNFWDLRQSKPKNQESALEIHDFKDVFAKSLLNRLNSDVPISIALSGGLDSASIAVGSLRDPSFRPVCVTYINASNILSLEDRKFYINTPVISEEALNARLLADQYKLKHVLSYDQGNFLGKLKDCILALECGHTSTSLVPASMVYKTASQYSKVILEGQGADELLCGYIMKSFPYQLIHLITKLRLFKAHLLIKYVLNRYRLTSILESFLRELRVDILNRMYCRLSGVDQIISFKRYRESCFAIDLKKLLANPLLYHIQRSQRIGLCNLLQYGDALSMKYSVENRNPFLSPDICFSMYNSLDSTIPTRCNKPLIREFIQSVNPSLDSLPNLKLGFPNQIVYEFSSCNSPAIQLLLSSRTLSRPIWNGEAIKEYVHGYLSASSKQNHKFNFFKAKFSYHVLYKLLSIELWHRSFID